MGTVVWCPRYPVPMALHPVELLAPLCLHITPSNHTGIEPGRAAALLGSRKKLPATLPAHSAAEEGVERELGGCVCTGGHRPGLQAELGSCSSSLSAGHASVLGPRGAVRRPDVGG